MEEETKDVTISIKDLFNVLIKRWFIIALTSIICSVGIFLYTFFISPKYYEATGMMYVNNKSVSISVESITSSDISAKKALVNTYAVIITSRSALEDALEEAKSHLECEYTYDELVKMISVEAVNSTEIFSITCKCENKNDSLVLVNTIIDTLPDHIENIIDGTGASIVDYAVVSKGVSKGYSKKVIIAFVIGFVLSYGFFFCYDLLIDDTIKSVDWIKETYKTSAPLLSVVPNVDIENNGGYYHYYENKKEEEK